MPVCVFVVCPTTCGAAVISGTQSTHRPLGRSWKCLLSTWQSEVQTEPAVAVFTYNKYPSPSVYQLGKTWGSIKPKPHARILCRGFFPLINARARDLLYLWYSPGHELMSFDILLGCFCSSRLCVASACNCGPCTGSPCMQSPKWLERSFSTCIRQLADSSGR